MKASLATTKLFATFVVGMLAVASPSSAVDQCCSNNGAPCASSSGFPYDAAAICPGGNLCGCVVSGTNCEMRLTANASTNSGDCLTLGAGVTLDMNGHSITCGDDNCSSAIVNTASSGAANAVVIENGFISGCWVRGIYVSGGTDSEVTGLDIDLARVGGGACNPGGLTAGILTVRGTVSDVTVANAFSGIYVQPGEDVIDSLVRDSYIGLDGLGTSASMGNITNVQLLNNGYSMKNHNPGVNIPDVVNLSSQNPVSGCHYIDNAGSCATNITDCVDFGSPPSGRKSFVDDAILP